MPGRNFRTFSVIALIVSLFISIPALNAKQLLVSDANLLRKAITATESKEWDQAINYAKQATTPLPTKIVTWLRFKTTNSGAPFTAIIQFIENNPDWPLLLLLRRRAEEAITDFVPDQVILNWFARNPPITPVGAVANISAMARAERLNEATDLAQRTWISADMSRNQERSFHRHFGKLLRPEDEKMRLDRLLWDQRISAARRQMQRVTKNQKALAEARILLIQRRGGVDAAIARIPDNLIGVPGLVYERLRWRRKNKFDESALELLPHGQNNLVRPTQWWTERHILTRRILRKGNAPLAYRLASEHGQKAGTSFAEAEWLAGWISLRFLHNPELAFLHFKKLFENVRFPISRSRGAYWAGRAAEAAGKHDVSDFWYKVSASHVTTFYGQLAATQLSLENQPMLPVEVTATAEDTEVFEQHELVRAIRILAISRNEIDLAPFFRQLSRLVIKPSMWSLTAQLARNIGRNNLAILVAKKANQIGIILSESGYPSIQTQFGQVSNIALVYAVIRQESAFDPTAVSPRGALGLMQLMPRTAQSIAKQLKIPHDRLLLTTNPDHNLLLGTTHLTDLLKHYDNSSVLSLAAYNAGKSRVKKWLSDFGDPRTSRVNAIDWIESIPISETRNYVQRVIENYSVYTQRLHGSRADTPFFASTGNTRQHTTMSEKDLKDFKLVFFKKRWYP